MSTETHPVVAAVLAETPTDHEGYRLIDVYPSATDELGQTTVSGVEFGDGRPMAARQAAAVLRWLARDLGLVLCATDAAKLDDLADEIEGASK